MKKGRERRETEDCHPSEIEGGLSIGDRESPSVNMVRTRITGIGTVVAVSLADEHA